MTGHDDLTRDPLAALVRERLTHRAEAFAPATVGWERVEQGLRAVRRRRLRRQAGLLAAGAAVVLGVVAGTLPALREDLRGAPPTGVVVEEPRSTRIFPGVSGSLAGDEGFLSQVRQEVAALTRDPSGDLPGDVRPSQVLVAFAGDVGTVRLVLVQIPVDEGGVRPVEQHVWFAGARGEAAADVVSHQQFASAASATATVWLPNVDATAADQGTGALVALSLFDDTLLVSPGLEPQADGSADWPSEEVGPEPDGHWEVVLDWRADQSSAGWYRWGGGATGWTELTVPRFAPRPDVLAADALPAVHGTAAGDAVTDALLAAQVRSTLPVPDTTRRVLWSGRAGQADVVVVAVTASSGAHVVTGWARGTDGAGTVATTSTWVVPAGPLEEVAFAWTTPADPADPGSPVVTAVLGPVGARTAVVTAAGGRTTPVTLDAGFGLAQVDAEGTVDFRDAAGRTVASAQVVRDGTSPIPAGP